MAQLPDWLSGVYVNISVVVTLSIALLLVLGLWGNACL
jgi:hypothetical protein